MKYTQNKPRIDTANVLDETQKRHGRNERTPQPIEVSIPSRGAVQHFFSFSPHLIRHDAPRISKAVSRSCNTMFDSILSTAECLFSHRLSLIVTKGASGNSIAQSVESIARNTTRNYDSRYHSDCGNNNELALSFERNAEPYFFQVPILMSNLKSVYLSWKTYNITIAVSAEHLLGQVGACMRNSEFLSVGRKR